MDKENVGCINSSILFSQKTEGNPTLLTIWMNLDIMLGEINQSQKDKYYVISLTQLSKITELLEAKRRMIVFEE